MDQSVDLCTSQLDSNIIAVTRNRRIGQSSAILSSLNQVLPQRDNEYVDVYR